MGWVALGCTDRNRLSGNLGTGFAGQVLVHPSYICQIGKADQGHFSLHFKK